MLPSKISQFFTVLHQSAITVQVNFHTAGKKKDGDKMHVENCKTQLVKFHEQKNASLLVADDHGIHDCDIDFMNEKWTEVWHTAGIGPSGGSARRPRRAAPRRTGGRPRGRRQATGRLLRTRNQW